MLLGLLVFVALLVLLGFGASEGIRNCRLYLEPRMTRVEDLVVAGEDEIARRTDELAALGFTCEGTWRYEGQVAEAAGQHQQMLVLSFVSPSRTTEVQIGVARNLGRQRVAVVMNVCWARSKSEDGLLLITSTGQGRNGFPSHPRRRVWRSRARTMQALLAEHDRHLVETGKALAPLEGDAVAREAEVSRGTYENWLAHGLIERSGDFYRHTPKLAWWMYSRQAVWPPCHSKDFAVGSLIFSLLLGASGAGAWAIASSVTDPQGLALAACALFAGLSVASQLGKYGPMAWGHVCAPAAIVFHLLGVTMIWPWLAALGAASLATPAIRAGEFRRQKALFEAAEAKHVSDEPPSSGSGAGG